MSGVIGLADRLVTSIRQEGLDRSLLYVMRYLSWKLQFHAFVRSLPNSVATEIYFAIQEIIRRMIWFLNKIYPHKYTDANPYKLIYVDPSTIERTTENIFSKRRGWVVNGDWDLNGNQYMQRTFARAIEQRFVEGLDWSETVLADKYEGQKLKEHADSTERVYSAIRDTGYKSQKEILEHNAGDAWDGLNDAMHPLANEVAVDIGRNGELLWNICGQHRLAISKVLDIDRIPVQVFRRHEEWQEIRDEARRKGSVPERFQNHPDLQDVLGE